MTNFNHVNCINQHRKLHVSIHIYHVCNTLFNLNIMLEFLVRTEITTFDVSHKGHIWSLQIVNLI